MKKLFLFSFLIACFYSLSAHSQSGTFDSLVLEQEEYIERLKEKEAVGSAKELIGKNQEKKFIGGTNEHLDTSSSTAPFGLNWSYGVKNIQNMGVRLKFIDEPNFPSTYIANNLPKPIKDFSEVRISFGRDNRLWRIAASGNNFEDDNFGSRGLAEYNRYKELLSHKYGNGVETYKARVSLVPDNPDDRNTGYKEISSEIGDENFTKDIASGISLLYTNFENEEISVMLALVADEDNNTAISLIYRHKGIEQLRDSKVLEAL